MGMFGAKRSCYGSTCFIIDRDKAVPLNYSRAKQQASPPYVNQFEVYSDYVLKHGLLIKTNIYPDQFTARLIDKQELYSDRVQIDVGEELFTPTRSECTLDFKPAWEPPPYGIHGTPQPQRCVTSYPTWRHYCVLITVAFNCYNEETTHVVLIDKL
ncbi:hypothetical protein J6590_065710 [Homalodisca vitripennis]|nr:hypothetical protein J6590_065710 [Homalodisca vitripennis]